MKKIIIITIIFSIMVTTCAYAKVGVIVEDPGILPGEFEMEPYAETLNTTRYAPWFLMYHMWSEKEKEMNRRAGEGGQIVMSLAQSPINPDLMLLGCDTSGLWRSTDGGQNWYSVNNNINMWSVPDVEFDPNEENTVYMIQTYYGDSDSAKSKLDNTTLYGVYKSTDAGKTWVQILQKRIYAVNKANSLMAFDASGALYVLTSEGLMKTTDGGDTWQELGIITQNNVYDLSVSPDGKTIITATADKGIMASFNGGATWQRRNGHLKSNATSIAIIPNSNDEDHWMAVFAGSSKGLYQSFNRGATWTPISYPVNQSGTATPQIIEVSQPRDGSPPTLYLVYSVMGYPFRYSNNLGNTWKSPTVHNQDIFGEGITGYWTEGICIDANDPDTVFYSFGDIVYKSTDGGANFHYLSSGFSGNYSNDYVFDEEGKIYFPFTDKGLGVTTGPYTDNEYPTARMVKGTGRYADQTTVGAIGLDPRNANHMIIGLGSWYEQILKETWNGGETWNEIAGTGAGAYKTIVFHPNDDNIIYTDHFTTRDGGETWQKNDVQIWDVSKVNPNVLWGKIGKEIARSNDGGLTWNTIVETSDPKVIKADLFDVNVAWVGCYNGTIVKITGNSAVTMGQNNGLIKFDGNPILIQSIAQNPENPLHLLAGGRCTVAGTKSPGLYETLDGGETWHVVPGLPGTRTIETIVFSKNTREAFIGGYTGTIIYEYDKYHRFNNISYEPTFSKRVTETKTINKPITEVGVIDISKPDANVYEKREGNWPDEIGTVTIGGVEYDRRIFYKTDLSSIIGRDIISAKLVINERRMKYGASLGVYKVTSDWNMSDISYDNAPTYDPLAIKYADNPGYQEKATVKEIDITNYVKTLNTDNNVANLMLKATAAPLHERIDLSHIHGIKSYTPPYIEITYIAD